MNLSSKTSSSFLSECTEDDEIDFADYSAPFLSGHGFALRCHRWYSTKMSRLGINSMRNNDCVYVRTDDLPAFFSSGLVPDKFTLVTHNSDFVIGEGHVKYMRDERVRLWLAMNKGVDHPKVKSIPDGLQNACYGYGNARLLSAMADSCGDGLPRFGSYKSQLFYANYTIDSRPNDRGKCAAVCQPQGIDLTGRKPYLNYLADVAASMFVLCPAGSGIDSCRPWEALYLNAIPIVQKHWTVHEQVRNFGAPIVMVDDWTADHFRAHEFDFERYSKMWERFDSKQFHMDVYCARLNELYGAGL